MVKEEKEKEKEKDEDEEEEEQVFIASAKGRCGPNGPYTQCHEA